MEKRLQWKRKATWKVAADEEKRRKVKSGPTPVVPSASSASGKGAPKTPPARASALQRKRKATWKVAAADEEKRRKVKSGPTPVVPSASSANGNTKMNLTLAAYLKKLLLGVIKENRETSSSTELRGMLVRAIMHKCDQHDGGTYELTVKGPVEAKKFGIGPSTEPTVDVPDVPLTFETGDSVYDKDFEFVGQLRKRDSHDDNDKSIVAFVQKIDEQYEGVDHAGNSEVEIPIDNDQLQTYLQRALQRAKTLEASKEDDKDSNQYIVKFVYPPCEKEWCKSRAAKLEGKTYTREKKRKFPGPVPGTIVGKELPDAIFRGLGPYLTIDRLQDLRHSMTTNPNEAMMNKLTQFHPKDVDRSQSNSARFRVAAAVCHTNGNNYGYTTFPNLFEQQCRFPAGEHCWRLMHCLGEDEARRMAGKMDVGKKKARIAAVANRRRHESTGKKVGVYYPEAGLRYSGSGKELGDGSVFVKKNGETKTVACAKCPHCSLYFYLTENQDFEFYLLKLH